MATKIVTNPQRCECGHVICHHGTNENPCGHVGCVCKGFVDASKCPICGRRYATTKEGAFYCRTCL